MTRARDMTLGELQAHAKRRNEELLSRRQALSLHFQQLREAIALKDATRRVGVILTGCKRVDRPASARRLRRAALNQNGKPSLGVLEAFNKGLAADYEKERRVFDANAAECRKHGWALMLEAPCPYRLHPTKGWRSGAAA